MVVYVAETTSLSAYKVTKNIWIMQTIWQLFYIKTRIFRCIDRVNLNQLFQGNHASFMQISAGLTEICRTFAKICPR